MNVEMEHARAELVKAAPARYRQPPPGVPVPKGPDVNLTQLRKILSDESESGLPGVSPNTRSAYRGAIEKLSLWLTAQRLTAQQQDNAPVFVNDENLSEYLVSLYMNGKSVAAAAQVISACAAGARSAGQWNPSGPRSTAVLAGYRKKAKRRGTGPTVPLAWVDLEKMSSLAMDGSPKGIRDAALLLTMWDAMLNASQAINLKRKDLSFPYPQSDQGLLVVEEKRMPLSSFTGSRLKNWLYFLPEDPEAPLFRRLDKSGRIHGGLTRQGLRLIVRDRARKAGVSPQIASRSIRAGAAGMLEQIGQAQTPAS